MELVGKDSEKNDFSSRDILYDWLVVREIKDFSNKRGIFLNKRERGIRREEEDEVTGCIPVGSNGYKVGSNGGVSKFFVDVVDLDLAQRTNV